MFATTSHQRMRTARLTTDQGCVIPRQRQGRANERRREIADSAGVR